MEEKRQEKSVDVIIPVYRPDEKLQLLLKRLGEQVISYPADHHHEHGTVLLEG